MAGYPVYELLHEDGTLESVILEKNHDEIVLEAAYQKVLVYPVFLVFQLPPASRYFVLVAMSDHGTMDSILPRNSSRRVRFFLFCVSKSENVSIFSISLI